MRESVKHAKKVFGRKIVTAVELGVAAGNNAQDIFDALRLKKLILIDSWSDNYSTEADKWLMATLMRFRNQKKACIMIEDVNEAVRFFKSESVDFIYIDDCHSPDHVAREIKNWWPKLAQGGIMAGHDYVEGNGRAEKAVKDIFYKISIGSNDGESVSDWWVHK